MKFKHGVLWDVDGVLVDTKEFHYKTWAQILSEYDIPFSRELFSQAFGMNNAETLSFLLGRRPTSEETSEIAGRKEALFRQAVPGHIAPLPGFTKEFVSNRWWGW